MTAYYEPLFLEDALHFLEKLPMNDAEKILYTIRKAQVKMDADLFKKIDDDLWEFRTFYRGFHYRLFAFIQPKAIPPPFVVITNGFIKRTRRLPQYEKDYARELKKKYLSANTYIIEKNEGIHPRGSPTEIDRSYRNAPTRSI